MRAHVAPLLVGAFLVASASPAFAEGRGIMSESQFLSSWKEGQPIPPGYHREMRAQKDPIIAGAIIFGVPYTLGILHVLTTDIANSNPDTAGTKSQREVAIPVIGAFLVAAKDAGGRSGDGVRGLGLTTSSLLVIDGLVQAAGLGLLIYGVAARRPVLGRDKLGWVTMTPVLIGKDVPGFGLLGRF